MNDTILWDQPKASNLENGSTPYFKSFIIKDQHGKKLNPKEYIWDEKNKILNCPLDNINIDFNDNNITFIIGNYCNIVAGCNCNIIVGSHCNIEIGMDCNVITKSYCDIYAEYNCNFITGDYCNFKTGSDCNFKTGSHCRFKTYHNCVFEVDDECTFYVNEKCVIIKQNPFKIIRPLRSNRLFKLANNKRGYDYIDKK